MAEVSEKSNFFRSSGLLAISTFISRILGFFREIMTAAVIGGGTLMSGWVFASMMAGIFRRVLGEGELGKVLVPIVSYAVRNEGQDSAQKKFSTILVYQTAVLAILTLVIGIPCWFLADYADTERWKIAFRLIPILMPYSIFICLVGSMTAYANSLRQYLLPSLAAILQNVTLIGALYFFCPNYDGFDRLKVLSAALLLSGLMELLLMFYVMHRSQIRIRINKAVLTDWPTLKELWNLILPGMIGASALQLSFVCDRTIAQWISDYAAPALYNSERLAYLPIGILAVSFATISNTEMSRLAAAKEYGKMLDMMAQAIRVLLFTAVPLTFFMFLFATPILKLFFYRGAFTMTALDATVWAFLFYVTGLPSFMAYKITTVGFTARKDMQTPFRVSILCVTLNLILNLILMHPLKQGGVALATVITSYLNNTILLILLSKQLPGLHLPIRSFGIFLSKLIPSALIALVPAWYGYQWIVPYFDRMSDGHSNLIRFVIDAVPLSMAAMLYLILLIVIASLLKMEEVRSVIKKIPGVRRFVH